MQPSAVLVAAVVVFVAPTGAAGRTDTPDRSTWARVATRTCDSMWHRMTNHEFGHWRAIDEDGPLSRVAVLRREWLGIHRDGLRTLRAEAPATTRAQVRAIRQYFRMLDTIRGVIRAAESDDRRAYDSANVRMVLSIQDTRAAFKRAGAGRICDFAI